MSGAIVNILACGSVGILKMIENLVVVAMQGSLEFSNEFEI